MSRSRVESLAELALSRTARTKLLGRAIDSCQPKVVLSFLTMTNVYTLMSTSQSPARIVVSERNDPIRHNATPLERRLRKRVYPRADLVTCNVPLAAQVAVDYLGVPDVTYLPNPLEIPEELAHATTRRRQFVLVGQLVPQSYPGDSHRDPASFSGSAFDCL